MSAAVVDVRHVSYAYGTHQALDDVSFEVEPGCIFGLLGPNGGGKSTLFRLLSTLVPLQDGAILVGGKQVDADVGAVRRQLGIVFQSAALDGKLTVDENLRHQGHLYGLRGAALRQRIDAALERFGLRDRRGERAERLSGGLRRRVEIAKCLLHQPRVLVLDEPSTGLDPGARRDLWELFEEVRHDNGVTILLTTHLIEEGESCDRVAILDRGRLVASGAPAVLEEALGGDVITIASASPRQLAQLLAEHTGVQPRLVGGGIRIQDPRAATLLQEIVRTHGDEIDSVTLAKPTLEDVFIHYTGHAFRDGDSPAQPVAVESTPARTLS